MGQLTDGNGFDDPRAILAELERVAASPGFERSARSARFLRYIVEQSLEGHAAEMKEYAIAIEVFDSPTSYDPQVDATVRVEAGKLRTRLQRYYESEGRLNPIRIEIPKGAYVPTFTAQATPLAPRPTSRYWALAVGLVVLTVAALAFVMNARTTAPFSPEAHKELEYGKVLRSLEAPEDVGKAIEHFRRAVALAPKSAEAHAELAWSYTSLVEAEGIARPDLLEPAMEEARTAIRLDGGRVKPNHAMQVAHSVLGVALLWGRWDWTGAEREMRSAIEWEPAEILARTEYARYCLIARGRYREAIKELEAALAIEPANGTALIRLASVRIKAGEARLVIPELRRTVQMHPGNPGGWVHLGIAESIEGRNDEAVRLFGEALRVEPRFAWAQGHLGFLFGKVGRRSDAEALIPMLKETSKNRTDLAAVYVGLGDHEAALEHLESALARRVIDLMWLKVDHRFDDLRDNPRFLSLLKRMGLQ